MIFLQKVVTEISRILGKDGRLLLWFHAVKPFKKRIDALSELFDKIHPHHSYPMKVAKLLREERFKPILICNEGSKEASIMHGFVNP